ncbi:profilin II [Pelomyxa schiedti]|nr:profilin II [Pelomyxa schiedti]
MSWQNYVDDNLVGSGFVDSAAILGSEDGSVWSRSSEFPSLSALIPGTEVAEVVSIIKDNFEREHTPQSRGIWAGGLKYMCVKADTRSVYGKGNKGGIVTVRTGKCVLVGIYGEGKQAGNAVKTVEDLADYLIGAGF